MPEIPLSRMTEVEKFRLKEKIGDEAYWQRQSAENRASRLTAQSDAELRRLGRSSWTDVRDMMGTRPQPPRAINPLNRTAPGWVGNIPSPDLKKPYQAIEKLARNGIKTTSQQIKEVGEAIRRIPSPDIPKFLKQFSSKGAIAQDKAKLDASVKSVRSGISGLAAGAKWLNAAGAAYGVMTYGTDMADDTEQAYLKKVFGDNAPKDAPTWSKATNSQIKYPQGQTVITPPNFPFTGGQSPNVQYVVNGTMTERKTLPSDGSLLGIATWKFTNSPISGSGGPYTGIAFPPIGYLRGGNNASPPIAFSKAGTSTTYPCNVTYDWTGTADPNSFNGEIIAINITLTRADGQPDTGGNPSPTNPGLVTSVNFLKLPDNFAPERQVALVIDGQEFIDAIAPLLPPISPVNSLPRVTPIPKKKPLKKDEENLTPLPPELTIPTFLPVPTGGENTEGYPNSDQNPNPQRDTEANPVRSTDTPVLPLRNTTQGNPNPTQITPSESPLPETPFKDPYLPFAPPPIPRLDQPIKIDPTTGKAPEPKSPLPVEPPNQTPQPPNCGCNAPLISGQQSILDKLNQGTQIPGQLADLYLLNVINNKLGDQKPGGLSGFLTDKFTNLWNDRVIDRAINLLTLATTIHNATMLSNNIGQTLVSAVNNVLGVIGIKDADGVTKGITDAIGNTVENTIKAVIGNDNYTALVSTWKKANRIYQASTNIFSALTDSLYGITESLEVIGKYNSRIGNGLKASGEVIENYYDWMSESLDFKTGRVGALQRVVNGLSTAQEVAEDIENITSNAVNVQENINTLVTETNTLKAEFAAKEVEKKDDEDEKEGNSASPNIADTDLYKPST